MSMMKNLPKPGPVHETNLGQVVLDSATVHHLKAAGVQKKKAAGASGTGRNGTEGEEGSRKYQGA